MALAPNPDPWVPTLASQPATLIEVFRLTGDPSRQPILTPLPSVLCEFIERHAGPDPGTAGFRYAFDGFDPSAPQSAEQALDTSAVATPQTVQVNDRLGVRATRPDGNNQWLFDGLVLDFRLDRDESTERVDLFAVGLAKRLWDTPFVGALMRDASDPKMGPDTQTELVAVFNPKGKANATDKGADANAAQGRGYDNAYPTFLDAEVCTDRKIGRTWTLPMAVRHLLYTANGSGILIANPDGSDLDKLLVAREPIAGLVFDPNDAGTYTASDIEVPERPITGRDLATTLHELLRSVGFDMTLDLSDSGGSPLTTIKLFLRQGGPVKHLYLQPVGDSIDPLYSNTYRVRIGRDAGEVVNSWEVHGALTRHEITVILAPGFPMASVDATATNLERYNRGSDYSKANPDAYRLFVFDEAGDGHYVDGTAAKLTTPPSWGDVFGAGVTVVNRRRPALPDLLTRRNAASGAVGQKGEAMDPVLSYSTDYATLSKNVGPCLWDGTGTWQPLAGGWELLKDRLGIRVTVDNPNNWQFGKKKSGGFDPLKLVEVLNAAGPALALMLTCVVESDTTVKGLAPRQSGGASPGYDPSPVAETITRVVDARDRYRKDLIHTSSEFYAAATTQSVVRDDTDAAKAEAVQLRGATEAGVLEGSVVVPYVTFYYRIGDRIDAIVGRGLGLRTDGGAKAGTPVYPMIEGIRWDLGSGQYTTLFLSDEATRRHKLERRIDRK